MCDRWVGPYQLLETLGKGKFAKVKLGIDHQCSPPRKVALKMIDLALFNDPIQANNQSVNQAMIKQAQREINALTALKHQSIIQLIDIIWSTDYPKKRGGVTKKVILIVLEFAGGGDLFEYLNLTGNFPEILARTYFHQLINGVSFAHSHGFAHRDLKPENLLLDQFFCLKIADFGLSNALRDEKGNLLVQHGMGEKNGNFMMYTECGTLSYLDPAVSRRGYDPFAADLWSCGVILFTMIAGFPPFTSPSMTDWWFNKLAQKKHDLFWAAHSRTVNFSPSVKKFISGLLTVDPRERMKTCEMTSYEWFCGESLSIDGLIECLRFRKGMIESTKLREKFEKDQKQKIDEISCQNFFCEDPIYRSAAHTFNHSNHQSVEADSDDLPLSNPCVIVGQVARAHCEPLFTNDNMIHAFDSIDLADHQSIDHSTEQTVNSSLSPSDVQSTNHSTKQSNGDIEHYKILTPADIHEFHNGTNGHNHLHNHSVDKPSNDDFPPSSDQAVTCLTSIEFDCSLDNMTDRLIGLMDRNHFKLKIKSEHRYKVFIESMTGLVTINIQIYSITQSPEQPIQQPTKQPDNQPEAQSPSPSAHRIGESPTSQANSQPCSQSANRWLVQFRRLTGDANQFRELFADMLLQLVD